jgi:hypothetical protein
MPVHRSGPAGRIRFQPDDRMVPEQRGFAGLYQLAPHPLPLMLRQHEHGKQAGLGQIGHGKPTTSPSRSATQAHGAAVIAAWMEAGVMPSAASSSPVSAFSRTEVRTWKMASISAAAAGRTRNGDGAGEFSGMPAMAGGLSPRLRTGPAPAARQPKTALPASSAGGRSKSSFTPMAWLARSTACHSPAGICKMASGVCIVDPVADLQVLFVGQQVQVQHFVDGFHGVPPW